MYCSNCGAPVPEVAAVTDSEDAAEAVVAADVEIARINADRDIRLAQIGAGVEKHVATEYAGAEAAAAEAKADVLDDILAPDEPPPGDVTIVVDDGGDGGDGGDAEVIDAEGEPPVIDSEPPPAPERKNPWWG